MLDWIGRNHQLVNVILSFGMLLLWLFYLQIFVSNYRRQMRANILIAAGSGRGLDAHCLVSNMSSEAIYIQSVVVTLDAPGSRRSFPVTELEGLEKWEHPTDLEIWSRQGPLKSGEIRDMGTFQSVLDHAARSEDGKNGAAWTPRPDGLSRFEIEIIAVYASEDLPVGARRRFAVLSDGERLVLRPCSARSHQIRSRSERRRMADMLEAELEHPD